MKNVGLFRYSGVSLLSLAFLGAGSASAFAPDETVSPAQNSNDSATSIVIPRSGERLIRPHAVPADQERFTTGVGGETKHDQVSKTPLLFSGKLSLNLNEQLGKSRFVALSKMNRLKASNAVEKVVRNYIDLHKDELGLSNGNLKFAEKKFFVDSESTLISFQYEVAGVPVVGADVSFRFSHGQLVQVFTRTFGLKEGDIASLPKSLPSQAHLDSTLVQVLGPDAKIIAGKTSHVIFPKLDKNQYTFHRAVRFEAMSMGGRAFSVTRSLDSAEVLEWMPLNFNYEGDIKALVNNRSVTDGTSVVGMPFVMVKATGSGVGSKNYEADQNGRLITPTDSVTVKLASKRFVVSNSSGKAATMTSASDVTFDASNSTIAETSTYYHLHVVQTWAKEFISPTWFDQKMNANVNINDACNAYYQFGSVNFFRAGDKKTRSGKQISCNNTGEIADVVYHEWGHGLDDNTGGIDDGAYSEGIGDIVSMFITKSPLVGPGFLKDGSPVRNLDGEYQYPPKADEREVHKEGLIIGATWYHLVQGFEKKYGAEEGRQRAKKLFLKSLYTSSQYTDVYDALLALNSEGQAPNEAPDLCLINTTFVRHGLAKPAAQCTTIE
jgi:hypothetical protein